jgi:hypothetical protein
MSDADASGTTKLPDTPDTASTPSTTSPPDTLESYVEPISLKGLIQGFPAYFKTSREIVLRPAAFIATLNGKAEERFGKAIEYVSYGILISFVLLIPTFIAHHEKISKLTFFVRFIAQYAIYGIMFHLALRAVGSRTIRLKGTAAAYGYVGGMFLPLYIVLVYPLLLVLGPKGIFGTSADVREMQLILIQHPGILAYSSIAQVPLGLYASVLMVKWFSRLHKISKLRTSLGLLVAGIGMAILQLWAINPLFNYMFAWVDKALDYM